ncbi:MAG: RNA-directed DNA polymerase [Deltaproteobacteria bacterium]|nr:RNA-directed DNA polymerase [Deltaproteobacteria bacterium]MBW2152290.1 RNA-directed DNA polymerase [Deltaproteobacteria bacterium]
MISDVINLSNFHAAFQRVEASEGMAGVDGVAIREFKQNLEINLRTLAFEIQKDCYRPLPLLQFKVAKKDGSPRTLAVPVVRDRVAQAAVLNVIEPVLEAEFEDESFAYRKGRSVKQAAMRIKKLREQGYRYVVEADIDAYFFNINHELLLDKVGYYISDTHLLKLIRMWVKAEIYDGEKVFILEKGIPQGSVVSPILANLFLDDFDEALSERGFKLVRYSDDFIILAKTRSEAEEALEVSERILAFHYLDFDEEDTKITEFEKGFKYLGLFFIKDSILVPFDRPQKEKKILYMPPPFDLERYLAGRIRLERSEIRSNNKNRVGIF